MAKYMATPGNKTYKQQNLQRAEFVISFHLTLKSRSLNTAAFLFIRIFTSVNTAFARKYQIEQNTHIITLK